MSLAASAMVVGLIGATGAAAALSFQFDRASARPGTFVVASQPGFDVTGVIVYFVPTRPPGVTPDPAGDYFLRKPPERHAIRLGTPHLTSSGRLSIRFRVPRVAPGNYTTAFWCTTCAKGGDFFASVLWDTPWTGRPGGVLRVTR